MEECRHWGLGGGVYVPFPLRTNLQYTLSPTPTPELILSHSTDSVAHTPRPLAGCSDVFPPQSRQNGEISHLPNMSEGLINLWGHP